MWQLDVPYESQYETQLREYFIKTQRNNFNKLEYPYPVESRFIQKHNFIQIANSTTLLQNSHYKFWLSTMITKNQHHHIVKLSPNVSYCLDDLQSIYINFKYNLKFVGQHNVTTFNLQITKLLRHNTYLAYQLKYDQYFKLQSYIIKFGSPYFLFKLTDQSQKLTLKGNQRLSPYLQTDLNLLSNTTIGVQMKIKQFEIQTYTKLQRSGFNATLNLNLDNGWKLGFSAAIGFKKIMISILMARHTVQMQMPLFISDISDNLEKYTLLTFVALIAGTILKCFQQPKIKQLSKEERIQQARQTLNLMEKRTKEVYKFEKENKGLLFIQAYYGKKEDIGILMLEQNMQKYHLQNNLEIIDVTLVCQFYTKLHKLHFPAYSKSKIRGFCDPCELLCEKQLLCEYVIGDQKHLQVFDDNSEVFIQ